MIRKFTYRNEVEFRAAERYFNSFGYYFSGTCSYPGCTGSSTIGVEDGYLWYNLTNSRGASPAVNLLTNQIFKALKNVL